MIPEADKRLNYPRLPEGYVEAIEPEQCLRYLKSHGWYEERVLEKGHVILVRHPDHKDLVFQLPISRKYADYSSMIAFAITTAAAQERRPYWEVYMDMAGRFYVAPHTYSTTPQVNGKVNGPVKGRKSKKADVT
jgi:hypothetical protein